MIILTFSKSPSLLVSSSGDDVRALGRVKDFIASTVHGLQPFSKPITTLSSFPNCNAVADRKVPIYESYVKGKWSAYEMLIVTLGYFALIIGHIFEVWERSDFAFLVLTRAPWLIYGSSLQNFGSLTSAFSFFRKPP